MTLFEQDPRKDVAERVRFSALSVIICDHPKSWSAGTAKLLDKRVKSYLSAHPQVPQEFLPARSRDQVDVSEPNPPERLPDSANDILHKCITRRIQCVCTSTPANRDHTGCLQLKGYEDANSKGEIRVYDMVFTHFYHPETEEPSWRRLRFHVYE